MKSVDARQARMAKADKRHEAGRLMSLGVQWRPQREDCVCSGVILAASGVDSDILAAVQRHQIEPVHIRYDVDHGIPLSDAQLRAQALDRDLQRELVGTGA